MAVHRKIDVSGGFTADADWADLNVSPEADGAGKITGLQAPIYLPRAGVDLLWHVTYYDGSGANASSIASAGATFAGEVVYECGSEKKEFKSRPATGSLDVSLSALETALPVSRKLYLRLTAAGDTPEGATHLWVSWEFVERRGT